MKQEFFGFRGQKLRLALMMTASLGFSLFGYGQGLMGGLLTLPAFREQFPETDTINKSLGSAQLERNATIQGLTVSIFDVGCMIGAISCIFIGDILGRRRTIFIGTLVSIVGCIIQACSLSLSQLISSRFISGIGMGCISATVPIWQAESCKPANRGKSAMFSTAVLVLGVLLSTWVDFFLSFAQGGISFRFPIAFQLIMSVTLAIVILRMPESPRWLVKVGRYDEAARILAALEDIDEDDDYVRYQIRKVRDGLRYDKFEFRRLFIQGPTKNFQRANLALLVMVFNQLNGITYLDHYGATLYEQSIGMKPFTSRLLAGCSTIAFFIGTLIPIFIIEKWGRRRLMLSCGLGLLIAMSMITGTIYLTNSFPNTELAFKGGIAASAFLFLFLFIFGIGWSGIPWLYAAEIVPLDIRAPVNGITTAANWTVNFLVVMVAPVAIHTIAWKTYLLFVGALAGIVLPTVYFLMPETKNRGLEEIDEIFRLSNSWLDTVKIAKELPFESQLYSRGSVESMASVVESLQSKASYYNETKLRRNQYSSRNLAFLKGN